MGRTATVDVRDGLEVAVAADLPPTGTLDCVDVPGSEPTGRVALSVRVRPPGGTTWFASFAGGYHSPVAENGVYQLPDPAWLLVLAAGRCYEVAVADPRQWRELGLFPVVSVLADRERSILAVADFTDVRVCTSDGIWECADVVLDGVRIVGVAKRGLTCELRDPQGAWRVTTLPFLRRAAQGAGSGLRWVGSLRVPAGSIVASGGVPRGSAGIDVEVGCGGER